MADKTFHLKDWTPKIAATVQSLIDKIHSEAPGLEVLFMRAAALELPGKNDIVKLPFFQTPCFFHPLCLNS